MRSKKVFTILALSLGLMYWLVEPVEAAPMGTVFTYQGRLMDSNDPADGLYDFEFMLYSDPNLIGSQMGSTVIVNNLDVIDGYFTVELDFGNKVFNGDARWLGIGVRPGDSSERHTILSPRQEVTPTPYALYAENAGPDNDWMVSGSDMYSIPSDNVGIGTTSPTAKLEVAGDMKMAIEDDIVLSLVSGITNSSKIALGQRFNNESAVIELDNTTGVLRFVRPFESNSLTIDSVGNIGIGTTSPSEKLDVEGNINVSSNQIKNYYGYPRPNYDSGWVNITTTTTSLFHSLGGDVDNYVVDLQFKDLNGGNEIHSRYYGGNFTNMGPPYYEKSGAYYNRLTTESIYVVRNSDEIIIDQIRVRIWIYN